MVSSTKVLSAICQLALQKRDSLERKVATAFGATSPVDMPFRNLYDHIEFRRKLQGEMLMSEGIKPGYLDGYPSTASDFSHRDSFASLNLAFTLKINEPDFSSLASDFLW